MDDQARPATKRTRRWRSRAASGAVALAVVAATGLGGWAAWGVVTSPSSGAGSANDAAPSPSAPASEPPASTTAPLRTLAEARRACLGRVTSDDLSSLGDLRSQRSDWARRYGLDRTTMPTAPDVAAATSAQRTAARELLDRTLQATAAYSDPAAAAGAGYDLEAAVARRDRVLDRRRLGGLRPGAAVPAPDDQRMPSMIHVPSIQALCDGKLLDPSAPEVLMYANEGGTWKLVGAMFTAGQAFPGAPPVPGGTITRWHYHPVPGGQTTGLMMHLFFAAGDDLAAAYSTTMPGMGD